MHKKLSILTQENLLVLKDKGERSYNLIDI